MTTESRRINAKMPYSLHAASLKSKGKALRITKFRRILEKKKKIIREG